MDDFYAACQEKVQGTADPVAAINELVSISLHDLPRAQICQFAEQATTLLTVIFQTVSSSPQNLTIKFAQVRQQLNAALNFMERIMDAEKEFPPPRPDSNTCWW